MITPSTGNQPKQIGTRRQNMEQKRGRQAWTDIGFIKNTSQTRNNDTLQKEYRTRASQLNTMIQINGLGQTLLFLKSKKEQGKDSNKKPLPPNAYDYLIYHLTYWMSAIFAIDAPDPISPETISAGYDNLLKWIINEASSSDYRQATIECLAFGLWLRRFAEAELKAPEDAPSATAASQDGAV